jgi:glutamate dehydrogenase
MAVANTKATADEIAESIAFLKWLAADHFVFFGVRSYDYPRDKNGAWIKDEPDIREELNLGILRDPLRMVLRRLHTLHKNLQLLLLDVGRDCRPNYGSP